MYKCSFCNLYESDNNPLLAGDDSYICSECILRGYKILYGDMEPSRVEMTKDKDEYFSEARDIIESMFQGLKWVKTLNKSKQIKVKVSFDALNKKLNGFKKGELVLLASKPEMGKTSLALNIAIKAMEEGKGVSYLSLKEDSENLMKRMLSSKTSISFRNLRFGELDEYEWSYLFDEAENISKEKIFIDDIKFFSLMDISDRLQVLKQQHPEVDLIFIDDFQRVNYMNETPSLLLKSLKQLAESLNITLIVLSQLESGDNKCPGLYSIDRSSQECVDTILFIYREEVDKKTIEKEKHRKAKLERGEFHSRYREKYKDKAEIIIGKSYSAKTGTVKQIFQNNFLRFVDID